MPIEYEYTAIPEAQVPRASNPVFQHLMDTYASETSKVISVWREFRPETARAPCHCSGTNRQLQSARNPTRRRTN